MFVGYTVTRGGYRVFCQWFVVCVELSKTGACLGRNRVSGRMAESQKTFLSGVIEGKLSSFHLAAFVFEPKFCSSF